jgi:hypothetical protein
VSAFLSVYDLSYRVSQYQNTSVRLIAFLRGEWDCRIKPLHTKVPCSGGDGACVHTEQWIGMQYEDA